MFVVPDGTGAVYDLGEDMYDAEAIDDLADEFVLFVPLILPTLQKTPL
jgi:hypothetical protein